MDNTISDKKYSTTTLFYKIVSDEYLMLSEDGKIKKEYKYDINIPELKIQNSKFIGKPEDKFETLLFLPPNPQRIAEGGLRTKGLFKFSYKLVDNQWHVCDLEGNPLIPAPKEIQEKINEYVNGLEDSDKRAITQLPLITVITVVYNGAKNLEETIKSILNQTYPNVEYIIIDGGSTDGTLDIIKKYEDKIDYWVSEPDEGIYDAMNKGIVVALGDFYTFLGSDDLLVNNWIKETFRFLLSSSVANKAYIYGNIIFQVGGREIPYRYKLVKKNELLKEFVIPHSGSIISAKLFRSGGLYEKKYKIIGDHAWVVKVHDLIHLVYIDFFQCKMKLGGTSNNPKTVKKILDELKIMEKEHSIRINLSFKLKKYLALIASYLGAYEKLQVVWWLMRTIRR